MIVRISYLKQCRNMLLCGLLCHVALSASTETLADHEGYAYRPGPYVNRTVHPGPGVDMSGMDLRDSVFVGMDLSNASFEDCDLRRARFVQVNFLTQGASFRGADLRHAVFANSPDMRYVGEFGRCDFEDALINDLHFVNQQDHLTFAQLVKTESYRRNDLSGCQLVFGSFVPGDRSYNLNRLEMVPVTHDFQGFDLRRVVFVAGDLVGCKFAGSNITGCTFLRSPITPEQIKSTICVETDIRKGEMRPGLSYTIPSSRWSNRHGFSDIGFAQMDLTQWDFTNADLQRARFWLVDLQEVPFDNADISGAMFSRCGDFHQIVSTRSYRNGDLSGISFAFFDLSNADFSSKNLSHCEFYFSNITGASFSDAVISNVDFRHLNKSSLTDAQIKSTWNYKHGRMSTVKLPEHLEYLKEPAADE